VRVRARSRDTAAQQTTVRIRESFFSSCAGPTATSASSSSPGTKRRTAHKRNSQSVSSVYSPIDSRRFKAPFDAPFLPT
jgi:hypothetical protein